MTAPNPDTADVVRRARVAEARLVLIAELARLAHNGPNPSDYIRVSELDDLVRRLAMTATEAPGYTPELLSPVLVPIGDLREDPKNVRVHSERNLDVIRGSLIEHGQVKPIVTDRKLLVVAGNGTLHVARELGWTHLSTIVYPGNAKKARAYAIVDNRSGEFAEWDEPGLAEQLEWLGADMAARAGFTTEDTEAILDRIRAMGQDEESPSKGELLALTGVTVGEPEYECHPGDVWRFDRHVLIVTDVHEGWWRWTPHLTGDALFWPYPSLLAPFTETAEARPVVMVQPNLYLAGWLLTKWHQITGLEPVGEAGE